MKAYIHIIFFLSVLITATGCSPDAQLPVIKVELNITANTGDDFISLNCSTISGELEVTERGFIITRVLTPDYSWEEALKYEDKIVLPSSSEFKAHLTDIFSDPMECKIFAYANINGRLYRSQTIDIKMKGNVQTEINAVKIEPNADNLTGKITIEGKNFSAYQSRNILEIDTLLLGNCDFYVSEHSQNSLCFNYSCLNIGSFPLRFIKGDQVIRLKQHLQVNGPKLKGFLPEYPRAQEWVEILVDDAFNNFVYGCDNPTGFIRKTNGTHQVNFLNVPKEANAQLWYLYNGYKVFLEPKKVQFSLPWTKMHSTSQLSNIKAVSNGWAYTFKRDKLYCYSPKNNKLEVYPISYPEGYENILFRDEEGICVMGEYVYLCHCILAMPPAISENRHDLSVMRFNIRTKQWEFLDFLNVFYGGKCDVTVCGNSLLIKEEYANNVIVYHPDNGTWEQHQDVPVSGMLWIGTYKGYFYYIKNQLNEPTVERVKTEEWNKPEVLYTPSPIDQWSALIYHAWIQDGYLYMDGSQIMRMDLSSKPTKVSFLGNNQQQSIQVVLPTPDGIYSMDYEGGIYRYVEDRIE